MLYNDGYIVVFPDREELLLTNFPPLNFSNFYPHTVRDNETLLSISNDFYQDSAKWYLIAEVNNLEDPFELVTGTILNLPVFQ